VRLFYVPAVSNAKLLQEFSNGRQRCREGGWNVLAYLAFNLSTEH
jgi:hypothetical protein